MTSTGLIYRVSEMQNTMTKMKDALANISILQAAANKSAVVFDSTVDLGMSLTGWSEEEITIIIINSLSYLCSVFLAFLVMYLVLWWFDLVNTHFCF